jgi:hypothetical protein
MEIVTASPPARSTLSSPNPAPISSALPPPGTGKKYFRSGQ